MTTVFPTMELDKSNPACQSSALGISFSQRGGTDLYPCMGENQQHFFIGQDPQELSYRKLNTSKQGHDPLYLVYILGRCIPFLSYCGMLLAAAPISLSEVSVLGILYEFLQR